MGIFLASVFFLGLYFFVRPKSVVIRSAGASIECPRGVLGGSARVHEFADTLEAAKHERLRECTTESDALHTEV